MSEQKTQRVDGRQPYLMARPEQLGRQIEEMKAHHSGGRAAPADQQ
jgi:hypothetical protein